MITVNLTELIMSDLPTTREAARQQKSNKYFTGIPCKHGHKAARYTYSGTCQACIGANEQRTRAPQPSGEYNLEPFAIRVSAENYRRVLELAVNLTLIRYPTVQPGDVERRKGGKDSQGGLLLYTLHMHIEDAPIVRQYAASLIPRVDVAGARRRILGGLYALGEARGDWPEFRP
jgi:hypothetical protein